MDDLICSGPPDSQSANSQSRNILAHFASKGWLFNGKKTKPPSFEARSFNAFQINSTSQKGFEIQGKPEALLAMGAMAGALIDMKFGIRRNLLSFPGKLMAYGLTWPDLVDSVIKCISLLTSGRDQAEEQAFYDQ